MTDDAAPRPAPYPADTRARGWRFELDYERIDQSDTWGLAAEIPMAQPALLMMWLVAWTREPCGSLPNDENVIRAKCKVPAAMWPKLRAVLMRGWWLADDGLLYHDTIAKRVQEMREYRRKTAERVANYKAAQREQRAGNALPTGEQWGKNDTGTGTGTSISSVSDEANASSSPAEPTKAGKRPPIPCPYDAIVDAYHQALPTLPSVKLRDGKTWTKRQKAMRELWAWVLSSRKTDGSKRAETGDEALAWIRGYFGRAAENDWVMGRSPRGAGHENWVADFDYLLTERGMRQVIERTRDAHERP